MFSRALLKKPCRNFVHGLSTAGLGLPDYEKALLQHAAYADALRSCGVEPTILAADEHYPDSVFIEDTAVLSEKVAVIARPGASSRRGEEIATIEALAAVYDRMEYIVAPGTLDGGDVLRAGRQFFIGISARTNEAGGSQLAAILTRNGYDAVLVSLRHVLHLKTGVAYLENNRLLASGEFIAHPQLGQFQIIPVAHEEACAANALWINGRVLMASGFAATKNAIENAGYETMAVDVSEFRRLDGGLSCLSLRF
ncbi:MAG: N(G),N(G)-dimethylarginine dimethylaminohydrolase [Candidatus Aminicenantes bacterium]|nr:N(G),N(G)-dimethylarginine dimethylaminohydrolase [Candidatus Aminicenantes bacterium]